MIFIVALLSLVISFYDVYDDSSILEENCADVVVVYGIQYFGNVKQIEPFLFPISQHDAFMT